MVAVKGVWPFRMEGMRLLGPVALVIWMLEL